MGDAGEGLVDSEARIQERRDEIERERAERNRVQTTDPEAERAMESLRLARAELERQHAATSHERRRAQLTHAMAEVDRRMSEIRSRIG